MVCIFILITILEGIISNSSQIKNQDHNQPNIPCSQYVGAIYGDENSLQRGYSVAEALSGDAFYVAGLKADSAQLLKLDLEGHLLWVRTFDIVPGKIDHVSAIIVDSEGMVVMTGLSGDINAGELLFGLRYDPELDLVLWAKTYMSTNRIYPSTIIQKGEGGPYLMTSNPTKSSTDDGEILELNKNSGEIIPGFAKHYHLGASEAFWTLVYDGTHVYGSGRFTDGGSVGNMRNAIIKLNANNGTEVWTKLGHLSQSVTARLYGYDVVLNQNRLYSGFFGDPSGSTLSNTKLYLQKTDMDGNVIWLKQYELPGPNDVGIEMIKSGNGIVILAGKRAFPSELILFKVDYDGNIVWSNLFQFPNAIVSIGNTHAKANQLVEAGDKLVFTGYGTNPSGGTNMIIVITDLNGLPALPCIEFSPLNIQVNIVSNPIFYDVNPTVINVNPETRDYMPMSQVTEIKLVEHCTIEESISFTQEATICEGEIYQGYEDSGIFVDTFISSEGCDSIRILHLTVFAPVSYFLTKAICQGNSFEGYYETGTYSDTFSIGQGCDSIRWLELIVYPENSVSQYEKICHGETYQGYSTTGIFFDTLSNVYGCDSTRILHLTVEMPELYIDTIMCDGNQFENYTQSGWYVDTLVGTINQCDTVRYLSLTFLTNTQTFLDHIICIGESYLGYVETGIYSDTFRMSNGCDSIRILDLFVTEVILIDKEALICSGETYEGYSATGVFRDTLFSIQSCDTIRTVFLTVVDPIQTNSFSSLCKGVKNGHTMPGTYIDTFTSQNGCDSIIFLELTGFLQYIPNVFSPNGDGINDVFSIFQFPENQIELEYFGIFDRFGNMAFQTSSLPIVWKGTDKQGKPYQPGVFAYTFTYTCDGNRINEHGNITLLK